MNNNTEYKTRTVAGEEIPEFILTENGAIYTAREIEERRNARKFLSETVLRDMAREIAAHITIRTHENGHSVDTRRDSTNAERNTLYNLALSALLALNHGEESRKSKIAEDAIINAAEYALILMLPDANSYDSIYTPLRKAVANWRSISGEC